jgi:hypothetical protein
MGATRPCIRSWAASFAGTSRSGCRGSPSHEIALACDQRGYEAKRRIAPLLSKLGHDTIDFGCGRRRAPSITPDHAAPAAKAVGGWKSDVGILLDGSGISACASPPTKSGACEPRSSRPRHCTPRARAQSLQRTVLGSDLMGERSGAADRENLPRDAGVGRRAAHAAGARRSRSWKARVLGAVILRYSEGSG